jgi:hypothetical protein
MPDVNCRAQPAKTDALTTEGYAGKRQAATLEQQRLTPEGLVEAAARDFDGFRGLKGLKAGKQQA